MKSIPDAWAFVGLLPILAGLWSYEDRWWLIGVGVCLGLGAVVF